uniref:Putative secreted protein n=1 Tax=Anopheles marajoara TaxID=58244 RepID=A0A2M4CFB7_9DIPT
MKNIWLILTAVVAKSLSTFTSGRPFRTRNRNSSLVPSCDITGLIQAPVKSKMHPEFSTTQSTRIWVE